MKTLRFAWLLLWVLSMGSNSFGAGDTLTQDVKDTIQLFTKDDPGLEKFFKQSHGYAVFPRVTKGAIGVGGAHGKGQVFEKGKLIGTATLSQATIGFQLGGQVYAEVIFFEDAKAMTGFKESKFALSAQASAVAAAAGVSKDAKYQLGVAIFTTTRGGLMYEASVGGQKFKFKPL